MTSKTGVAGVGVDTSLTPVRHLTAEWQHDAEGANVQRMAVGRITWDDIQAMPEDGKRYEAIDGEMYVTPAPTTWHQAVSLNLTLALARLLVEPRHGRLFYAPVGVEFPETDEGVQPDLVFVATSRLNIVHADAIKGAPDLVVEILSPKTAGRDRGVKLQLYRRKGVAQYWIVDIDAKQVEVWSLATAATDSTRHTRTLAVTIHGTSFGSIDLARVFDWPA